MGKKPVRRTSEGRDRGGVGNDGDGGRGRLTYDWNGGDSGEPRGEPELVLIARTEFQLRATPAGPASEVGEDVSSLSKILEAGNATLEPLFGLSESRIRDRAAAVASTTGEDVPDLSCFYSVRADPDRLEELCEALAAEPGVEGAYVKPPAELAVTTKEVTEAVERLNDMRPDAAEPPVTTPNFTSGQVYLNPAPAGIDARYAWTMPGGRGAGVNIIDCEWGWRFTHEDLRQNQGGVLLGPNSSSDNHGTAVLGEFGGDGNPFGVTGICQDARCSAVSFMRTPTSRAIRIAADRLSRGDIILLEIHRPGPRATGSGQQGFIAIEWWPDDFAAIRYAVGRGVIVVEAAGNGGQNFDDPIYDRPATGFPSSWRNPLNPANPSSGAVVVGAGNPPPGIHGRTRHPTSGEVYVDRARCGFSNYGRRVDTQGWGWEVTTTGYGDLQGGANRDEWYTDQFSGTSSASPIVVGALGCVQGILRARGAPLLTSPAAIALLRRSGSPQQDAPGRPRTQRIGNRPNLRQLIADATGTIPGVQTLPLYRYWNPKAADHFYTTNWRELGSGRHGWRYEGIQCHIFPRRVRSSVPLYRYWNPKAADHFYTTNWRELGSGRHGWRYEGVQGYVYPRRVTGTVPLYRYWNGQAGDHFYTTNWGELGSGRHGWRYEGVQCYVSPRPTSARPPSGTEASFESSGEMALDDTAAELGAPEIASAPEGAGFTAGIEEQIYAEFPDEPDIDDEPADDAFLIEATPGSFRTEDDGGPESGGEFSGTFESDVGGAATPESFAVQGAQEASTEALPESFRLVERAEDTGGGDGKDVNIHVHIHR